MPKIIENKLVNLIAFHDGETGDINDNEFFTSTLGNLNDHNKGYLRVLEFYEIMVQVYRFDDKWMMFFTNPKGGGALSVEDKLDAYIIETYYFYELWNYFAQINEIAITHEYVTDLINYTVNYFSGVSDEKIMENE